MLQTYEAILNDGQLTWLDRPPVANYAKVLVTVVSDNEDNTQNQGQRRTGSLAGKIEQPTEMGRYDLSKDGEKRLGFMLGEMIVPDDINKYDDEILEIFGID